ncbi:MAG: hypothetical protein KAS32_23030 [Candidatus Peribacteraceae bacterium]|nr:hypothetical protein [Candidatus Peribacteraceae bacterium]
MKSLKSIIGLEVIAIFLAVFHGFGGLKTDEAKYLLNIPYPHPPLARWIMSVTEWMPIQEMFWRILLATLVIQSVWFVIDIGRDLSSLQRRTLGFLWIFSAGTLLQAGSIMMAPITAFQALVFVWLLNKKVFVNRYSALIGIFWIASLFTAYQIILFSPIVFLVFWKTNLKKRLALVLFFVPIILLAFYTLTNPFVLASMVNAGTQNIHLAYHEQVLRIFYLWIIGGSGCLSVIGLWGMIVRRQWAIIASLILLFAYTFLSYRPYYAILFLPLLIAGASSSSKLLNSYFIRFITVIITAFFVSLYPLSFQGSIARTVANKIENIEGVVLIKGIFGHEWQYEISQPLRVHKESLVEYAEVIVCIPMCEERIGFSLMFDNDDVQVWIRSN